MNKLHKKRMYYFIIIVLITAIGVGFILYSLKNNLNIFLTPRQISSAHLTPEQYFRLGGLVKKNSIHKEPNSLITQFTVTDNKQNIIVQYEGVLPDLFREESGVIAQGYLNSSGVFIASTVLAKHDETYMPKNVYQSIRENAARD